jgi:hypothetical protein
MRGEREIALTTPVSLTAFQPSLWDGSSLLPFQAFHAWLRSQVPTGQNPTGSRALAAQAKIVAALRAFGRSMPPCAVLLAPRFQLLAPQKKRAVSHENPESN